MKRIQILSIGIISWLIMSCTSSKVIFNNNSEYHSKIKSAFIQIKDTQLGHYLKGVGDSLAMDLEKSGVKVKLLETDLMSLTSDKDIQKEIKEFDPQTVILLERIDNKMSLVHSQTIYDGGTYLMSIILPDTNKIVWKASFTTKYEEGGLGKVNASIKKTLEQIEAELKRDQLL